MTYAPRPPGKGGPHVVTWILVRWVRDFGASAPMDSVVWIPPDAGVPNRCLCGYGFPPATPADAQLIECEGPFRHVWRDCLLELEERIRARDVAAALAKPGTTGESGRSTSTPAIDVSTGPEDETPVERPDSSKGGRSAEYGDLCECGHPRSLHAGDKGADTYCEECGCGAFKLYAHEADATLVIGELPACTTCHRVGHLAADCPNEGGQRGKA